MEPITQEDLLITLNALVVRQDQYYLCMVNPNGTGDGVDYVKLYNEITQVIIKFRDRITNNKH